MRHDSISLAKAKINENPIGDLWAIFLYVKLSKCFMAAPKTTEVISVSKVKDIVSILDDKKVVVVTHLKDIDGISSVAIAMNVFGERLSNVVFSDFEVDA